jgi:cytidyltransferase-like protein
MTNKKVLVSGCFDLLHGGHIAFFKTASSFGDLYVSIGREDIIKLGNALSNTFLSWKKILPFTVPDWVMTEMVQEH